MGKESTKVFLSRFNTRGIGGGGDENERCENMSVQRPPQCKAVGVHSDLIIENKPEHALFSIEIFKYRVI